MLVVLDGLDLVASVAQDCTALRCTPRLGLSLTHLPEMMQPTLTDFSFAGQFQFFGLKYSFDCSSVTKLAEGPNCITLPRRWTQMSLTVALVEFAQ